MPQPQASPSDRLCRSCGIRLAHDHATDLYCSACQRSRRDYDPRHDRHFAGALLALLTANPGRGALQPLNEASSDPDAAGDD